MLVVHLSTTPLVGAPGGICHALRLHAGVEARWGVLAADAGAYHHMSFELDLRWDKNRDEIIDLARRCDVLHLHNFIDLDSRAFAPIDIRRRWDDGQAIVRHFHSTPALVARAMGTSETDVLNCPIPKLVIAQYPERYYPTARLVPNLVQDVECASVPIGRQLRIGYAPSRFNPARASRWDTKGYPETVRMLRRVERIARARGLAVSVDTIEQVPHGECLARKARCHIVVDDLVTGSYHLNTLESLAAGSAVLTYIDQRTQQAIVDITGRIDFPAINVGLEHAEEMLLTLCSQPDLVRALGQNSRDWMSTHWAPQTLSTHFLDAYRHVMASPHAAFPARDDETEVARWRAVGMHDVLWRSRSRHWPRETPSWWLTLRGSAGRILRKAGLKA